MKRKKPCYFKFSCRLVKPTPQRVLAIEHMVRKLDPAEVRKPAREEIADYAIGLAREQDPHFGGVAPRLEELFHWPAWVTPCQDDRKILLPLVEKFKQQAEKELRAHYAYYHALAVRRQRWLRAHPQPQARGWTTIPLRHAAPVPRKRIFRPPDRDGFPDAVSPPVPATPETSTKRPGWRESEGLLCFSLLFGNHIAVSDNAGGTLFHRRERPFRRRREFPVLPVSPASPIPMPPYWPAIPAPAGTRCPPAAPVFRGDAA